MLKNFLLSLESPKTFFNNDEIAQLSIRIDSKSFFLSLCVKIKAQKKKKIRLRSLSIGGTQKKNSFFSKKWKKKLAWLFFFCIMIDSSIEAQILLDDISAFFWNQVGSRQKMASPVRGIWVKMTFSNFWRKFFFPLSLSSLVTFFKNYWMA